MNSNERLLRRIMSLGIRETWEKSIKMSEKSITEIRKKIDLSKIEHVYVLGCGSSLGTAYVGESWIEHIAKTPAKTVPAFQFLKYVEPELLKEKNNLVIGITAAGVTASIEKALRMAKEAGAVTVAVTGTGDLPCALAADATIVTDSLNENPDTARTTSYIHLLLGVLLFAIAMGEEKGCIGKAEKDYWEKQLETVLQKVEGLSDIKKQTDRIAQEFFDVGSDRVFVLGTGPNRGTMEEGALKIVEFAWIFGAGEETEDFVHGRFRESDDKNPIFIIAPNGKSNDKVLDVLAACAISKTPSIVLTDVITEPYRKLASHIVKMPEGIDEYMSPLLYVIPLWLYGYQLGFLSGMDVGTARHGITAPDINYAAHYDAEGNFIS